MSEKLTVATILDVVGIVYAGLAHDATHPETRAQMVARAAGYAYELELLLRRGGRDPRQFLPVVAAGRKATA